MTRTNGEEGDVDLEELAERDGWTCWLCRQGVTPDVPGGGGPSVDHVVPRARGGGDEETNLRLAHRSCNSRRGSRLPELTWPELGVSQAAPLWPAVLRAQRRVGEVEVVGIVPDVARVEAEGWLRRALALVGPHLQVGTRPGPDGLSLLTVRARSGGNPGTRRRR